MTTPTPPPLHVERAIDSLQVAILTANDLKRTTETNVTGLTTLYAALRAAHAALVAMATGRGLFGTPNRTALSQTVSQTFRDPTGNLCSFATCVTGTCAPNNAGTPARSH